jgi:hypothetical protein
MSVLSHPVLSPTKLCSQAQGRGSVLQSDAILDAAELDIRGNGGDHEELDLRYRIRSDAKLFFMVGRVFTVLWHESLNTYNYQGVAKKGLSPEDRQAHSVIYMDDTKPAIHPTEKGMMFNLVDFEQKWSTTSLRPVAHMALSGVG